MFDNKPFQTSVFRSSQYFRDHPILEFDTYTVPLISIRYPRIQYRMYADARHAHCPRSIDSQMSVPGSGMQFVPYPFHQIPISMKISDAVLRSPTDALDAHKLFL